MKHATVRREISARFKPFLDEILGRYQDKIHSIHIVGSALTDDYDPQSSDINSVFVLHAMDFVLLAGLAPLGKKYGKKGIAAPLIMTPSYIVNSLDVFPLEFLNIKMLHTTVFGSDIWQGMEIRRPDLRQQCERELKVKLIGLRQGYIASSGNRRLLTDGFVKSFSGYLPLFKGIITLLGREAPPDSDQILATLEEVTGVDTGVFKIVLRLKREKTKSSGEQLNTIFEDYYKAVEKLGEITDALEA
ncbi:MAG: hypothetical protein JSW39_26745 [Desulfobacterales bacterium]|nr:MAG: hypothetical protein JSW39_26745 [Desulfobacterales bacterium]